METSTVWWLLTGVFVALELATGTFYLLMLALGLAAGAVAAHLGFGATAQLIMAALFGGGCTLAWHRLRPQKKTDDQTTNQDVHLDIGATVNVETSNASQATSVMHRGASWSARLVQQGLQGSAHSGTLESGLHRIVAVEGNTLVLSKI
jgi:membrane protein implicated in regulation of membrane protease activity